MYDEKVLQDVCKALASDERFTCIVGYYSERQVLSSSTKPFLLHTLQKGDLEKVSGKQLEVHAYLAASPHFVLPDSSYYDPASAALAHTRSLVFLRKHIGGPYFDLEAIWDEHTRFEFEDRSLAKTMGTMVVSPSMAPVDQ